MPLTSDLELVLSAGASAGLIAVAPGAAADVAAAVETADAGRGAALVAGLGREQVVLVAQHLLAWLGTQG